MNVTKHEQRKESMRKQSKRMYYKNDGRIKSLFKYYKRKFINDEYCVKIIDDLDLNVKEKLKFLHKYNQQIKLERLT